VITALGLQKPAVLGHSMGAVSTLGLVSQFPDLPGAILLEDPPMWWNVTEASETERTERAAGMRKWILSLKDKSREELIAGEHAASPLWSDDELGPWADSKLRVSEKVVNIFEDRFITRLGWPEGLKVVTCPMMLITSDPERGAIVTPEGANSLQAVIPQLQVVHLPGAGHNIRREQFVGYVEAVRAFLASAGV
jgi:pimeloyl-ACP methyl ester carboxylesterase